MDWLIRIALLGALLAWLVGHEAEAAQTRYEVRPCKAGTKLVRVKGYVNIGCLTMVRVPNNKALPKKVAGI